jgi:putative aminopeptidase FrvX
MTSSQALLVSLSNAVGTPGNEDAVRAIMRQALEGSVEFSTDRLGSLICRQAASTDAPKVMLAGHLDEIGLLVRYVTNDGFVKFHPLGGWWSHVLLAQQVVIKTRKGDVPGIIGAKPVHHLTDEERKKLLDLKDLFVDVGAKDRREAQEAFGIQPGDHILPATRCTPMYNARLLMGKGFDDRVGVALVIEALQHFANNAHPNLLYGVGTVQEELRTRGATTAVEAVQPDVAIVLEGPPADDFPGVNTDETQGRLGYGPQIRLFDPTMITNRKLADYVLETARTSGIPHQIAVRVSGGTDAEKIHVAQRGVPTIVIGVPVRYAHSHVGIISLDDYEHSLQLLIAVLTRLDAATATALTAF